MKLAELLFVNEHNCFLQDLQQMHSGTVAGSRKVVRLKGGGNIPISLRGEIKKK